VVLIDQNALPLVERHVVCKSYKEVISAIKDLTVRGAPALGVAAAMGAALGALQFAVLPPEIFRKKFFGVCDEIAQARPTARNLFWALARMKKYSTLPSKNPNAIRSKLLWVKPNEFVRKTSKSTVGWVKTDAGFLPTVTTF